MFGKGNKNSDKDYNIRKEKDVRGGSGAIEIVAAKLPHEDPDVLEYGYLIVPIATSIGIHKHVHDWESWEVQKGSVIYYGGKNKPETIGPGMERICLKGQEHGLVNNGDSEAVILYTKYR